MRFFFRGLQGSAVSSPTQLHSAYSAMIDSRWDNNIY